MRKLSTGQDSTLEVWIRNSVAIFGADSRPVKFLRDKADKSPNGYKEEVWADEAQLMMVLLQLNSRDYDREYEYEGDPDWDALNQKEGSDS